MCVVQWSVLITFSLYLHICKYCRYWYLST